MPAPNEKVSFKRYPGRVTPDPSEHIPTDKHGRTLQTQWDSSPDWGRETENRLISKRNSSGSGRLFK